MKNMKTSLCLLSVLMLPACMDVPPGAYYNHGDPENLLQVTTESVHVNLNTRSDIRELAGILKDVRPTRAELSCPQGDSVCAQAVQLLDAHDIPASYTGNASDHSVALLYQRTVAHDCENRYIDNTRNQHNLPAPTLGCSVTANMVQMVTNKNQFTNPGLLDYPDADKAAQTYSNYAQPSAPKDQGDANKSVLSTVSTGQ